MKLFKYVTHTILLSALILTSCGGKQDELEAQKLLDKQAEILENQHDDIDGIYNKMSTLSDSMNVETNKLQSDYATLSSERENLSKIRTVLEIDKAKVQVSQLLFYRDSLKAKLTDVSTELKLVTTENKRIEFVKDSLEHTNVLLNALDRNASSKLISGITQIDGELAQLEREEQKADRMIDLTTKRINISDQKRSILGDEILLLNEDKNNALRDGNNSKRLSIESEITTIEREIATEREKVSLATQEIEKNKARKGELISKQNLLKSRIGKDYDTQNLVGDFMSQEKESIATHLSSSSERAHFLTSQGELLSQSKQFMEQQMSELDQRISSLNESMNELNGPLIATSIEGIGKSTSTNTREELIAIEKALSTSNENFKKGSSELENEYTLLATQKEARELRKADNYQVAVKILIAIIGIVVLLLMVLFVIGKKRKKKVLTQ